MSRPVFQVSKETKGRERLAELRREMDEIEVPPPADPEPPITTSLESLVETRLKEQLTSNLEGRELGLVIMNAIKFLAVRAKIPMQFGSELDEVGS